ncbi:unnamed protein product, partial [Nesidiocoris tenuis]
MIPTKFKPLVSDSSGESSSSSNSPKVTKEALEQGALIKYQEALDYERKGEWNKAEHVLKELLKTEILAQKNIESWSDDSLHTMDLYRIFKEGEDEFNQAREDESEESKVFVSDDDIPPWMQILFIGHDYLG